MQENSLLSALGASIELRDPLGILGRTSKYTAVRWAQRMESPLIMQWQGRQETVDDQVARRTVSSQLTFFLSSPPLKTTRSETGNSAVYYIHSTGDMAIPEGADVAIVIGVVLLLFVISAGVFLLARRLNMRRQARQRAAASSELDLDFDTSDAQFWPSTRPTLGHARDWSTASADLSRPLISPKSGWSSHMPTSSLESNVYSTSVVHSSPPHSPPLPVSSPVYISHGYPSRDRQNMFILPEEDNYLTRPEYHPTFLTNPRPAPSPQGPRRERSRGRQRTRSGALARLTSTKSSRKARSLDGRSMAESASSIYSQASATTTVWMEVEGKGHGEPTPLPLLPTTFQLQQTLTEEPQEVLASPSPSRPRRKVRPKAHVLARHLARAENNTLDSDPFIEDQRQGKMLKDSLAYPLPSRAFSPMTPHKNPGSSFSATILTFPSPPSSTSSPTPVRPSPRVAYPSVPTYGITPQPQSPGSTDWQDYKSSHSEEGEIVRSNRRASGEQSVIGCKLHNSWRSGQISRIRSPLDGLTYKLTSSIVQ